MQALPLLVLSFCCELFPLRDVSFLSFNKIELLMGNLLYIIAVILVIGWLLGFFVFHLPGIIHLLLVIAVIAILLRLIRGGRV